jgi:hypothetical protein
VRILQSSLPVNQLTAMASWAKPRSCPLSGLRRSAIRMDENEIHRRYRCRWLGALERAIGTSLAEDGVRAALIDLVEMECGHRWSEHPATARVLQLAINALLARYGARGNLKFAPGELPDVRQIAVGRDDPGAIAIGVEAVVYSRTWASIR